MSDQALQEGDYPTGKVAAGMTCLTLLCLALAWWLGPVSMSAVAQTVDLSEATFVEVRTLKGQVAMSGELRSRVDQMGNVEKDAALIGPQGDQVIGEIEIEIPRNGAPDPRQELEVDVISLQPLTSYEVFVNDRAAATFTTDDRGSVDVEFVYAPPLPR